MSIVALKRKTAATKNLSTGLSGFSINGTTRNQGYIGQSLESRTLLHTPHKGAVAKGHGGCCGTYNDAFDITPSEICSLEDSTVVKQSVLSTKGMLAKRNRWINRPFPYSVVKPDSNHGPSGNANDQSSYLERRKKKLLADIDAYCPKPEEIPVNPDKCTFLRNKVGQPLFSRVNTKCKNVTTKTIGPMSYEEKLAKLAQECTANDPTAVVYSNVLRIPLIGS